MRKITTLAAAVTTLGALAAVAVAGEPASFSGDNFILQVQASPPKAGTTAKPRPVALTFDSREYTDNGLRPTVSSKTLAFRFTGFRFHPEAFAKCLESKLEKTGPSACPAKSKLGAGTAVADARPALPAPVSAKAQLFNGTIDVDATGKTIPSKPGILVYAKAPGIPPAYIPTYFQGTDGLITQEGTAPPPGGQSLFTISALHVALPAKTTKLRGKSVGFIEAPKSCPGGQWKFTQTNVFFSGGSVTSHDSQPCVR
jgi:hypothetical protein